MLSVDAAFALRSESWPVQPAEGDVGLVRHAVATSSY